MQRPRDLFSQATAAVGSVQTKQQLTWTCVRGEQGTLGEYYSNSTFIRQGCGVIQPLEIRPGRFIRKACPCERAVRDQRRKEKEIENFLQKQIPLTYNWLGARRSDVALAEKTFENFDRCRAPDAWDSVRLFAGTRYGTLILHSETCGTGKTHLLAAVCNELHRQMVSCRFMTAPGLFNAIQTRIKSGEPYTQLIEQAIMTPLLVIDDIDKAKWSEFREEVYFEIIDERTQAGRPIAISTNRFADLAHYVGEACASRLCIGLTEIELTCGDYRREMM